MFHRQALVALIVIIWPLGGWPKEGLVGSTGAMGYWSSSSPLLVQSEHRPIGAFTLVTVEWTSPPSHVIYGKKNKATLKVTLSASSGNSKDATVRLVAEAVLVGGRGTFQSACNPRSVTITGGFAGRERNVTFKFTFTNINTESHIDVGGQITLISDSEQVALNQSPMTSKDYLRVVKTIPKQ